MTALTWSTNPAADDSARDFRIDAKPRPVTGAFWAPASPPSSTPLVLCGHGASGDRYQAPITHLATRFRNECGFAVLSIDGPVHGLRQVGPGGREAFAGEMRRAGFIDEMVRDWHTALEHVRAETGLGAGPLGYFGLSMGTMFGIPLLASGVAFSAAVIGLCGAGGAARHIGARLLEDAGAIAHPVLFLMQLEDELFDREGYLALFDAIAAGDKRLHANPGLHPEVPAEEVDHAFDFLAQRLTETVPRRIVNPLAE